MGLVESEWISTLSTINPDDVNYESYVEIGRNIAKELREKDVTKIFKII